MMRDTSVEPISKVEKKLYGATIVEYLNEHSSFRPEELKANPKIKKIRLNLDFYGQVFEENNRRRVFVYQSNLGIDKHGIDISGASMPVVYIVEKRKGSYKVVDYKEPRDSPDFEEDKKKLFPEKMFSPLNMLKRNNINFEKEAE